MQHTSDGGGTDEPGQQPVSQPPGGRATTGDTGEQSSETNLMGAGQGGRRRGHAGGQTGNREPAGRRASGGGSAGYSTATVRFVAAVFGVLGGLSVYGGLRILQTSGTVPVAGAGLELFGLVSLAFGVAHLYAAYGLWTHRRRGWQVAAFLVCAGALLNLVVLLAGAAVAVIGLLVNGALGWGLHINREPFRRRRANAVTATGSVGPTDAGQAATHGQHDGYASERRGRQ
jgi:hypothetical protein